MYNQFVQGNAELLSISSNDSIWNSEDEEESTNIQRSTNQSSSDRQVPTFFREIMLQPKNVKKI